MADNYVNVGGTTIYGGDARPVRHAADHFTSGSRSGDTCDAVKLLIGGEGADAGFYGQIPTTFAAGSYSHTLLTASLSTTSVSRAIGAGTLRLDIYNGTTVPVAFSIDSTSASAGWIPPGGTFQQHPGQGLLPVDGTYRVIYDSLYGTPGSGGIFFSEWS